MGEGGGRRERGGGGERAKGKGRGWRRQRQVGIRLGTAANDLEEKWVMPGRAGSTVEGGVGAKGKGCTEDMGEWVAPERVLVYGELLVLWVVWEWMDEVGSEIRYFFVCYD